jgi:hypothetical protein
MELGYNYTRTTLQFTGAPNVQSFFENQQDALTEIKKQWAELNTNEAPSLEVTPKTASKRVNSAPQKAA